MVSSLSYPLQTWSAPPFLVVLSFVVEFAAGAAFLVRARRVVWALVCGPRVLSGPAGVQFEFILKFSFWVRENLSGYGVVGGMRGQWRACYGS